MKKRLIYLMLSAAIILCGMSINIGVYAASDSSAASLLQGLNIVCGFENTDANLRDTILKSSFINFALNIANDSKYTADYDADALAEAERMGLIVSASAVSKNDILSGNEAVKIAVCLLGYRVESEQRGGYPTGYAAVAQREGVLKGVTLSERMTYAQAFRILCNILDADHSNFIGNGDGNGNYLVAENKINALEYFRKTYRMKGVVTDNGESGLYNFENAKKGYVKVDDVEFFEGSSNAGTLLGHKVEVFYKENRDGENEIIYVDDLSADKVMIIKADDVENVTNNNHTIEYYCNEDSNRTRSVKISADAAYLLNGVAYADCKEADFKKEGTEIVLISSGNAGNYDVVNLLSYDTMLLSSVSSGNKKLYNRYTFDGAWETLDLSEYKDEDIFIYKDGAEAKISDLAAGDVISVFKTPKGTDGVIKIYADSNRFEGTVESYSEAAKEVVINGKTYEISDLYYAAAAKSEKYAAPIKAGQKYIFRMGRNGKIVSVETVENNDVTYGYVTKYSVTDDGPDERIKLRVFMMDGSWESLMLAEKIKHNGKGKLDTAKVLANDEIMNSIPGLIGMKLNADGEISEIKTAVPYSDGLSSDTFTKTETYSDYRYRGGSHSWDNNYYVTDNTKVFIIPNDTSADESLYSIGTKWSFEWDEQYTFTGYNRDEYYFLDMIVNTRDVSDISKVSDTVYLVKAVGEGLNSDGDVVSTINVASEEYAGVSFSAEDKAVFEDVKKGDIIKIHVDANGNVDKCLVVYSTSQGMIINSGTGEERNESGVLVGGILLKSDNESGKILLESDREIAFPFSPSKTVLIYDVNSGITEIGGINSFERGDYVMVCLNDSEPVIAVVYRNLK